MISSNLNKLYKYNTCRKSTQRHWGEIEGVQEDVRELKFDFQRVEFENLQSSIDNTLLVEEMIFAFFEIRDVLTKQSDEMNWMAQPTFKVLQQTPADLDNAKKNKEQRTHYRNNLKQSCLKAWNVKASCLNLTLNSLIFYDNERCSLL